MGILQVIFGIFLGHQNPSPAYQLFVTKTTQALRILLNSSLPTKVRLSPYIDFLHFNAQGYEREEHYSQKNKMLI